MCSSMARATFRHKSSRSEIKDERNDNFYNYYYSINDADSHQFKKETKKDGRVTGSYGIVDPDGRKRTVYYVADENGFRAKVDSNEPGVISMNPADIEIMKFNQFNHFMNGIDKENSFMPNDDFLQSKTTSSPPEYMHPIQPEFKKNHKKADNNFPVSYTLMIDHNDFGAKLYQDKEKHSVESSKSWNHRMTNNLPSANVNDNYIFHKR
ncbi:uncharacterized protein [Centruroides vittatus]|uniref:uncharacterized protein n=1 Tax=Centruroides vittatus TaxID=120091 RepID=UPI00350F0735